ncbi:hypothetical protein [Streptomyces sp. NPDC052036]|uniref:hypothetical protein n=1 Tax=Streptomyces sp. NPDC052036 TaxID=3155171 RepID=UPI00344AD0C7
MTNTRSRRPVTRLILWISGGIAAFIAAFWAVTSTADLALAMGVYGVPGIYRVESCHDTDYRRNHSKYDCYRYFTPHGGSAADAVYVHLDYTGHNYPDGTEFDARQGLAPETIQRTGIRGVVDELWQVGFAVAALGWIAYLVVRPATSRKPKRSPEPSRREKAAVWVGLGVVDCAAVGVLGLVANVVESLASKCPEA